MRNTLLTTCLTLLLLTGCTTSSPGTNAAQLTGKAEDQVIALEANAQRQLDGMYTGKVTVTNKTQQDVNLLYDCGSQLEFQGVKPPKPPGKGEDRVCPGVHSSVLGVGKAAVIDVRFASDRVADWNALAVSVRYEVQDGSPPVQSTVTAQLRPNI